MSRARRRFRKALNGCERRFEFVRNVGDEIPADALELAQLGDVVQHDDRAERIRGADRGDGYGEKVLAQRPGDDFGFHPGLAFHYRTNGLQQLGLPHDFNKRAARLRRYIQAQDFREAGICKEQALGRIHHRHAFHHAAENGGGKIAFFGQRSNGAVQPRGCRIQRNCERLQAIAGAIRFDRAKIALGHA